MDVGTKIIITSFAASIALIASLKILRVPKVRSLGILLAGFTSIWVLITAAGEFIFAWAGNSTCSKYLGCVEGFFGYDAFEHFFFGVSLTLALIWVSRRFPKYSLLHDKRWKTILTIIAIVALVSVCWEMLECMHDYFRIDILGEHLFNFKLHINALDQPTNLDTMGDLSFSLLGSVVTLFTLTELHVTKV